VVNHTLQVKFTFKIPGRRLEFEIITWWAFNLEYFFVYEFESKFLSDCILCACSSTKNGTKAMSMPALHDITI